MATLRNITNGNTPPNKIRSLLNKNSTEEEEEKSSDRNGFAPNLSTPIPRDTTAPTPPPPPLQMIHKPAKTSLTHDVSVALPPNKNPANEINQETSTLSSVPENIRPTILTPSTPTPKERFYFVHKQNLKSKKL